MSSVHHNPVLGPRGASLPLGGCPTHPLRNLSGRDLEMTGRQRRAGPWRWVGDWGMLGGPPTGSLTSNTLCRVIHNTSSSSGAWEEEPWEEELEALEAASEPAGSAAGSRALAEAPRRGGFSSSRGFCAVGGAAAAVAGSRSHKAPPRASDPITNSEPGAPGVPRPPAPFTARTSQLRVRFQKPLGPLLNSSDLCPGALPSQKAHHSPEAEKPPTPARPGHWAVLRSLVLSPPLSHGCHHLSHMPHCLMGKPQPAPLAAL